jgi:hypothetical protein
MKNTGNLHVRPLLFWTIRPAIAAAAEISRGKIEYTVLLPSSTLKEPHVLQQLNLAAGRYTVTVLVDFQDGKPQQSIARDFEVLGSSLAPTPAGTPVSAMIPEIAPAKTKNDGR